jgi:hypothetical protein
MNPFAMTCPLATPPRWGWVGAGLVLAAMSGCYDGQRLIEHAHSTALNTRLVEVDLGSFHTTLPRDAATSIFTELEVRLFGTVPRYRASHVEEQLRTEEYRLRHGILAVLRGSTREELTEPSLARLRKRIEAVVNGIVAEAPVKSIGIADLRVREV